MVTDDTTACATPRPDSAAQLKAAHDAADLKRTLEAAIKEANDPATIWIDHDTLFDKLEA